MIIWARTLLTAVAVGLIVSACGSTSNDQGEQASEIFHDPKSEEIFYSTGVFRREGWYRIHEVAKQPPLRDAGINRLLVVLEPAKTLTLIGVDAMGVTQDTYKVPRGDKLSPKAIERRIVEAVNQAGFVQAHGESDSASEIGKYIAGSGFPTKYRVVEDGLSSLNDLRSSGVDAILYVKEIDFRNPFSKSLFLNQIKLGSAGVVRTWQGVVYGWDVTAFAGFAVALLSTEDGKEMDRRSYIQLSAKALPDFEWRGLFEVYSENEKSKIVSEIQERVENNIGMALKILKLVPVEGERFLEPSDLPATDKVRFDYPQ